MTSKGTTDVISTTRFNLVSGNNKISVTPSSSMTSDIPFILPPDQGGTSQYLRANGLGVTQWANSNQILIDDGKTGPTGNNGPSYHPPTPVTDLIRVRSGELLAINLISNDTPGGSLTAPTAAITSVTIIRTTTRGTLTNTGLGTYTYRSYPRYKGYDSILYSITDSNGVVSKARGFCFIHITEGNIPFFNRATGVAGTYLTYNTATNRIRYYKNGTDTILRDFAAEVGNPIDFGSLTVNGLNSIATNRDDNVIYFANTDLALLPATQRGRIYGWDYVNDILFLVVDLINDAAADSKFDPAWFSDLSRGGAAWANKSLYIGPSDAQTRIYYRVTLWPYNFTATGRKQPVAQIMQVNYTFSVNYGDLTYDPVGRNIALCGQNTQGDPSAGDHNVLVDPLTGFVKLYAVTELSSSSQIGVNVDGTYIFTNGTVIYRRNFNGTTLILGNRVTLTSAVESQADIGSWISEL